MPVRAPVIAGNWKMHNGPRSAAGFVREFVKLLDADHTGTLILFPPALSLTAAREAAGSRRDIAFGVQNVHWEAKGAFTGETSPEMAAEAGATYTLVGHSERRHVFGETDEMVAQKVAAAFRAGLTPVVCVGELLEERRAARVQDVILRQLDAALSRVSSDQAATLLVAYEPVWAIGTGVNATPADASEAHALLRGRLGQAAGAAAERVPILYGGSVKPANSAELLAAGDVDGLLVGGASLEPEVFAAIARSAAPG